MQTFRLAQVAARAEGLRWQRHAQRTGTRIMLGVVGLVFLVGTLAFAHVAAFLFLSPAVGPAWGSVIVAGADLVLAGLFLLLARGSGEDRVATEARAVRDDALRRLGSQMALTALAGRIFWMLRRMGRDQSRPR